MVIKKDTLDQLLAGRDPRAVFAKDGLVDELKKALANRVLSAELDDHLDGEAAAGKANRRNGCSKKTVLASARSWSCGFRATARGRSIPS